MPAITIEVRVKPSARTAALVQQADGSWLAQLKSPAREGKANRELLSLIASHFHCTKAAVSIRSGTTGRRKLVRIDA